jgi:hypothetical protein
MTAAASASRTVEKSSQPSLDRCQEAVAAAERLLHLARAGVRKAVEAAGGIDAAQGSRGSRPMLNRCARCWAGPGAWKPLDGSARWSG